MISLIQGSMEVTPNFNKTYKFVISICIVIELISVLILISVSKDLKSNPNFNNWILLFIILISMVLTGTAFFTNWKLWKQDEKLDNKLKESKVNNEALILEKMLQFRLSRNETFEKNRVEKLEQVWTLIREMRDNGAVSRVIFYYQILKPEEYNSSKTSKLIPDIDEEILIKDITKIFGIVNKHRIYISNDLFLLVKYYQAFVGNITFLTYQNKNKNSISDWTKDGFIMDILSNFFKNSKSTLPNDINPWELADIIDLAESEIAKEIKRILSGETDTEISLKQISELNKTIKDNSIKLQP